MVTTPTVFDASLNVNPSGLGSLNYHGIADIGGGRFVAVWAEAADAIGTSPGSDIVAQIFDAEGNPIGDPFQANQTLTDGEERAISPVEPLPGGGFVVLYRSFPDNTLAMDIYDADGNRVDGVVIGDIVGDEWSDSNPFAVGDDGTVMVTYLKRVTGDDSLYGRIVDPDGVVGNEFLIKDDIHFTANGFFEVVALTNGDFVAVVNEDSPSSDLDYRFIIVDDTGAVQTTGLLSDSRSEESNLSLTALKDGGFAAAWSGYQGSGAEIWVRVHDNDGTPVTGVIELDTPSGEVLLFPAIGTLDDGGFVVSYQSATSAKTYMQRFDAEGGKVGDLIEVPLPPGASFSITSIDTLSDGRFAVNFFNGYSTIYDPRDEVIDGTSEADVITSRIDGATVNGLGGDDELLGQESDDILDGGTGADVMRGREGNDTFFVDNAGDQAIEEAGEGTDTVFSSIAYTLGANIENLTMTGNGGTGTGNGLDNILTAAGTGNTLRGLAGDDTYFVDDAGDMAVENPGEGTDTVFAGVAYTLGPNIENLTLTGTGDIKGNGNGLANTLRGNDGDNQLKGKGGGDLLAGGLGADILKPGKGKDQLLFDTGLSKANADTVKGFKPGKDTVLLDAAIFSALGDKVNKGEFRTAKKAKDGNDHLLYHEKSGKLFYDENGDAGGGRTLVATFKKSPDLDHKDFDILTA